MGRKGITPGHSTQWSLRHFILCIPRDPFTQTGRYASFGSYVTYSLHCTDYNQSYSNWLSKPLVVGLHIHASTLSPYARFWDSAQGRLMSSQPSEHSVSLPASHPRSSDVSLAKVNFILSSSFLKGCLCYNILSCPITLSCFSIMYSPTKYFLRTYNHQARD